MPANSRERKSRLDKGGGGAGGAAGTGAAAGAAAGGFIGFSAFATSSVPTGQDTSSSIARQPLSRAAGSRPAVSTATAGGGGPPPSPVFTGSDVHLHQLFRRIGQKKDATTRVRALSDLAEYAFSSSHSSSSSPSTEQSSRSTTSSSTTKNGNAAASPPVSRQDKVAALSHLIYLSMTKLLWDNAPSVRCQTMSTLGQARQSVPKAWKTLVLYGPPSPCACSSVSSKGKATASGGGSSVMSILPTLPYSTIASIVHGMRTDPSSEVKAAASDLMSSIRQECDVSSVQCSVVNYSLQVLALGNADALDGAVFGNIRSCDDAGAYAGGSGSVGKGKKNKGRQQQQPQQRQASGGVRSESDREESEERYERTILTVLGGLSLLVKESPENEGNNNSNKNKNNNSLVYSYLIVKGVDDDKKDGSEARVAAAAPLWRHLTSSRSPFRRATYSLLSHLSQHAPSLLHEGTDGDDIDMEAPTCSPGRSSGKTRQLPNLIPTVITSEHDPGNIPKMLDFVLSYIASFRGVGDNTDAAWDPAADGIDPAKTVSALAKLFRRGCHGSPAVGWCPIALPLVASLPIPSGDSNAMQMKVLAALWEGKEYTGGGANEAAVVTAVVETSTFLLLRRLEDSGSRGTGNEEKMSSDDAKEIAGYVFRGLEYYLTKSEDSRRDAATSSLKELCNALSRDLQRLDVVSDDTDGRKDCILFAVRVWFWADGGIRRVMLDSIMSHGDNGLVVERLGDVVRLAADGKNATKSSVGRLPPILRDCVSEAGANIVDPLSTTGSSEGSLLPPKEAEIHLMLEVLKFCGVSFVLNSAGDDPAQPTRDAESYILGAIVPWVVTLFSSSALSSKSAFSRDAYIEILCVCLESIPSLDDRRRIWASGLKDMVDAHVDLNFLTKAIVAIAKADDLNIVRCEALDEFAMQVGDAASMVFRNGAVRESGGVLDTMVDSDEFRSMRLLLQTFVGLSPVCSQVLIGEGVIQSWINVVCQQTEHDMILEDDVGSNVLLDLLLAVASTKSSHLCYSNLLRLTSQSWKEGGQIWTSRCWKLLKAHKDRERLLKELQDYAKAVLEQDLCMIDRHDEKSKPGKVDRMCLVWSNRCSRLFGLCGDASLVLAGLDNVQLWKSSYSSPLQEYRSGNRLFACLRYVLQSFDDPTERRKLLCGDMKSGDTATELTLHVLLSLVDASPSLVPFINSTRHHQCFELFSLIGDAPREYLVAMCRQAVNIIANEMNVSIVSELTDHRSAQVINRSVALLDLLTAKLFGRRQAIVDSREAEISQHDVKEGDILFYVANDGSEVQARVQCRVAKIHRDDYPNLYFTIRIDGEDGKATERQTVAGRLKKRAIATPPDSTLTTGAKESVEEGADMTALIVNSIIKPYLSREKNEPAFVSEAAAECCSIAISRSGLGNKSGLGSLRFDVFQVVSSLESEVRDALLNADSVEDASLSIRCLALALGFGSCTEASPHNNSILKLSSLDLIDAIHGAIGRSGTANDFYIAVLMFLSVAFSTETEGETFRKAMTILEAASTELINTEHGFVVLLRGFSTVQKQAHSCIDYSSADSVAERQVMSTCIKGFAATPVDETTPTPIWLDLFTSLLNYELTINEGGSDSLLSGARKWNEALCDTLFSSSKRWCGYQLLMYIASEQREINPGGQLSEKSRRRVKRWKSELDSEEAQELQDDASGAAKWLPECVMTVVEGWYEMSEEDRAAEDEEETLGKLLTWLVCLSFLDNAAAVDIRNRSALTAYLDKSSAVGEALMLANRYANLSDKKMEWMDCLKRNDSDCSGGSSIVLSDVATLVVFRTIESVPTLAKKWWMDDCPRSIQPQVSDFVQKRVAPETLRRELSRINNVKNTFGDMNVSGSTVSREVSATYVQDECTLSVLIKVPASFPLRNAEVDCKKTLGIPEKRWRRWGLQITRMLNHEDGSVLDALLLWKQNVDKEFEGVEPCPVCYSVLCVKTHTMPNLECKTCENRFHSSCLMKWFQR